ncbi:MAG: type III pantothenate kinase [Campylobacterota bacterium]
MADIGNSYIKVYERGSIIRLGIDDGIKKYDATKLYFISVNNNIKKIPSSWIDISDTIEVDSSYRGLGIDRKAVCMAVTDGVIVDAGSAITIDIMLNGVHLGGYLLPGIEKMVACYAQISDKLNCRFNPNIELDYLPQNTQDAISYSIIQSIKGLIEQSQRGSVYFTGGDGKFLSKLIPNSIYDETLIFKGMMKGLQC